MVYPSGLSRNISKTWKAIDDVCELDAHPIFDEGVFTDDEIGWAETYASKANNPYNLPEDFVVSVVQEVARKVFGYWTDIQREMAEQKSKIKKSPHFSEEPSLTFDQQVVVYTLIMRATEMHNKTCGEEFSLDEFMRRVNIVANDDRQPYLCEDAEVFRTFTERLGGIFVCYSEKGEAPKEYTPITVN